FLEIDLIDKICDYIKLKMFIMDHPWFDSYRFSFSTNGLLYSTLKVQKFIHADLMFENENAWILKGDGKLRADGVARDLFFL
ncbi:MAG: hypothetical protein RR328_02820, partial [Bacteroidales bacterium]